MTDVLLTDDGDLYISESGDIKFTNSVLQAIKIKLRWFLGEWRINTTYGMPYYDEVFIKNPSLALLEDRIRTEILSVDGVQSIESVDISVDKATRECVVKFTVVVDSESIDGEVSVNV